MNLSALVGVLALFVTLVLQLVNLSASYGRVTERLDFVVEQVAQVPQMADRLARVETKMDLMTLLRQAVPTEPVQPLVPLRPPGLTSTPLTEIPF